MNDKVPRDFASACPVVPVDFDTVQLAHGGGGRLMRDLLDKMILPAFAPEDDAAARAARPPHDSAVFEAGGARLAMTTDTFVVDPLFFPGGDIGKLAVCGTVNDLAMAGARPLFLSAGFVLEEGLSMESLGRIMQSMRSAADAAGVRIVTGDTKVVDRGKGDGIFINTAGVGLVRRGVDIAPDRVTPGDAILVSGDLGRHGIAVMSVREGLEFEGAPASDCGPLAGLVDALLELEADVHCLRDLTRGGLAAALIEIAEHAGAGVELREADVPVAPGVAGACELLGLDPLYVANEGRLVAFVAADAADRALEIMHAHDEACGPARVGTVTDTHAGTVRIESVIGGTRLVDLFSGEQMPRIC